MKICDRCGQQRAVKATERIYIETEGQELDLCKECLFAVVEFATSVPKRINKPAYSLKKPFINRGNDKIN